MSARISVRRAWPVLAALVPLTFCLVWLPFKFGGQSAGWLGAAEVSTFVVAALLVAHGRCRRSLDRGARSVLVLFAAGGAAALLSFAFSKDLGASFSGAIEWLWLGAEAVLVSYVAQYRRGREVLVGLLMAAVFAQVFWSSYAWWGSQDPRHLQVGTFFAPNQYAGYVLLLAPLSVAFCLTAARWIRAAAGAFSAVFLYLGIALSGSRGGAVAAGAGLLAMVAFSARRWPRRTLARLGMLAIFFVALGVVITGPLLFRSARSAVGPGAALAAKGADPTDLSQRLHWDEAALEIGVRWPLAGTGPGTFGAMLFRIEHPQWQWSLYAHDQYLEVLAEGGILLFAVALALPLVGIVDGFRALRRGLASGDFWQLGLWGGLVGGSLHLLVDHDWSYPAYAAAFVCVVVLLLSPWGRGPDWPPSLEPPSPRSGWALRAIRWCAVGVCVLCVLALAAQWESYRLQRGGGSLSEPRLRLASALAPFSSTPLERLGLLQAAKGRGRSLAAASASLRSAVTRDRLDIDLRWQLAGVDQERGASAEAAAQYQAAIHIDPESPAAYLEAAAFQAHVLRDTPAAVATLDAGLRVIRLVPTAAGQSGGVEALAEARSQLTSGAGG